MRTRGFTIPELSIVITVIGILLVASIVGYGTWRVKVSELQVKSDLLGVATGMDNARNFSDAGYPVFQEGTVFDGDNGTGDVFEGSDTVTVTYAYGDADSYCVEGVSEFNSSIAYYLNTTSDNKEYQLGSCIQDL